MSKRADSPNQRKTRAGPDSRPVKEGQLVVFGTGHHLVMRAAGGRAEPLGVLQLGGLPIRAPIAFYGPFVMNTREEIQQALDDYLAGRLGVNPKILLSCRY